MQRLVFVFANLILLCSCARIVRQVKGNVESQVRFGVVWLGLGWLGMVWDSLVQQDHRLILGLLSLPRQSGPVQQRLSQACGHHQGGDRIVMRNINEKPKEIVLSAQAVLCGLKRQTNIMKNGSHVI